MCLGIPMTVVEVEGHLATVEAKGIRRPCDLSLVGEDVAVGEHVLVHVGYAIAKVDEEEVKKTMDLLDEILAHDAEAGGA